MKLFKILKNNILNKLTILILLSLFFHSTVSCQDYNNLYRIAIDEFEKMNFEVALLFFIKCQNLKPNDPELFFYKGITNSHLKKYKAALTDLDSTIKLKPNSSIAHFYRGVIKSQLSFFESAIEDFNQAERFFPINEIDLIYLALNSKEALSYDEIFYSRAFCKVKIEMYVEAINDYSKAIEVNPKNYIAIIERGMVYNENLNNYQKAVNDFNIIIDKDSDSDRIYSAYFLRGKMSNFYT